MTQSIFFKITLLFVITFIGMGISFLSIHDELEKEYQHRLEIESGNLLLHLRKSIPLPFAMRQDYLQHQGYDVLTPSDELLKTLDNAISTLPESFPEEIKDSMKEGRIQILKDDHHLYIYLSRATPPMLILKPNAATKPLWPEILFVSLMLLLIFIYWLIIKTLFPLKILIRTITEYGKEGIYTPMNSTSKDEIALVARALDSAMQKSRLLMDARRLFLRNIMHELKTPITVGKLALPFLKKSEEKSILERAFFRMEHLIGELVRVEQITSGTLAPRIQPCQLQPLIEKAKELLFLTDEAVEATYDGTPLYADCEVFVTVFKNLIDNAIKYSPDHKVRITQHSNQIVFSNTGEPWPSEYTLETLSEPFFHHENTPDSFGLGLYIVKSVIEAHDFKFLYHYDSGEHRFILESSSPLSVSG